MIDDQGNALPADRDNLPLGPHTLRPLGGRRLLHTAVQEEIKRYIIGQALQPGAQLPSEGELARMLAVGRNSVREAVKSLQAMGIIDVRVGSGLFVKDLDFDPVEAYITHAAMISFRSLNDLRDVRKYLELGFVDTVVERRSMNQLHRIEDILTAWKITSTSGAWAHHEDRQFHEACWQHLDNPVLGRIMQIFWQVVQQGHERGRILGPEDTEDHYRRHVAIYEALRDGDSAQMRGAIAHHYEDMAERTVP